MKGFEITSNDKEENRIYLDYQATTPIDSRIFDEMLPYMREKFGNPHSSEHVFGWDSNKAVETATTKIASYINALERRDHLYIWSY